MKNFFFLSLISLFLFSCSSIQETISVRDDAVLAKNLPLLNITQYKYTDLDDLRILLDDYIKKYNSGVAFYKKSIKLYDRNEQIELNRQVEQFYIKENLLKANIENMKLYYPQDWKRESVKVQKVFNTMFNIYHELYERLI